MPKKPGRKHRVSPLEQPRQSERAARGQRHDDRLAEVKDRLGERALAPRQAEIGPARGLPAHRRALAKAEHDDFSLDAKIDRRRYPVRAISRYFNAGRVIDAALRQGRLEPIENGHGVLGPARRSPRPQHLARRRGQRTDNGEASDFGG